MMLTYDKLSDEVKAEMIRLGKLQLPGLSPEQLDKELEKQYNDAQAAIHGNPDPYPGHALTRGLNRRRGA